MITKNIIEDRKTMKIGEILLLNKRTGLPIFSRSYLEQTTSQKDPCLIAGLMAAIISFAEVIGHHMTLSDIGVKEGRRMFIRSEKNLICLITVENCEMDQLANPILRTIVENLSLRLFDTINMITDFTSVNFEGDGSFVDTDGSYIESTLAGLDIGPICDNIVLEASAQLLEEETVVEDTLEFMQESDTTYLDSTYQGSSAPIKTDKKSIFRRFFSKFNEFKERGEE